MGAGRHPPAPMGMREAGRAHGWWQQPPAPCHALVRATVPLAPVMVAWALPTVAQPLATAVQALAMVALALITVARALVTVAQALAVVVQALAMVALALITVARAPATTTHSR